MWHPLRDYRRWRLRAAPFPLSWELYVTRAVSHYRWLDPAEQQHLRQLVRIFIAEKHWDGCGGLELTDEIRVTIAAQACMLILGLPNELYRNVLSIFVYPSTVLLPPPPIPMDPMGPLPNFVSEPRPIVGVAHRQGPVVLVWDAVKRAGRHPERGHNVVYHEFAHKLDMLDGRVDGTPPLHGKAEYARWAQVCSREYLALRAQVKQGVESLLDEYAATNEGEFFAVVTELFFDRPLELRDRHPQLYEVFRAFYRQDPAARVEARRA